MSGVASGASLASRPAALGAGVIAIAVTAAGLAGLAVAFSGAPPAILAGGAAALALLLAIMLTPLVGPWTWLLLGPLIVGVARGDGTIPLRPNELLLLIGIAGITFRGWWHFARGERFVPAWHPVDTGVALLLVTGSIMPLLLRYGRGLPVSPDDVLYGLIFLKYSLLYFMFRVSVRRPDQVGACLRIALVAGLIVAIIAVLQVEGLLGVRQFLFAYYDAPFEGTLGPVADRGSSTIASSFGLADVMAMCLALAVAMLVTQSRHRLVLGAAALMFVAAGVAAGSFSGVIGLVVVVLAVGFVTRRLLAQLAVLVPTGLLAAAALWPIIAARLAGFDNLASLPHSWSGRLQNLERFFWPEIFSGFNWLWGVRPAARVAAPEAWRNWVNIESGHTWLLWVGGVPLLFAFMVFMWIVAVHLFRIARADPGPVGVAASAGFAAAVMIFVLTLFDPHLTVRGSADLFFPLLALSLAGSQASRSTASAGGHTPIFVAQRV